jgi:4-carboxymuconolactone decarboxylase
LLGFAAASAVGDRARLARELTRARRSGTSRAALEETALMLVLYAGFPAALEALALLLDRWPGAAPSRERGGPVRWRHAGAARCRAVYGPVYDRLMRRVRALHPDLSTWTLEIGYGRVLSRPVLGGRTRELLTVAMLAATDWERQLVSHLLGAARLGASEPAIRAAVAAGARARGTRATARRAWHAAFG